jgi:hypothetical protein
MWYHAGKTRRKRRKPEARSFSPQQHLLLMQAVLPWQPTDGREAIER